MPAPTPLPEWAEHPEPLRRGPVVGEAVRLLVAGWQVLLVGENKRPLFLPGLQEHGFKNATSDLEELERRVWAAGDRIASAGVAVLVGGAGSPFAVDLDGPCAVQWAEQTLGDRLAEVPRERTAHGMHLFFSPAPELRRQVRFEPEGWSCECGAGCGIDLLGHLAEDEKLPPSQRRPAQALVVAPTQGRTWVGPGTGLPRPEALPSLPEGWVVQAPRPKREAVPVVHVVLPEGVAGTEAGLGSLERVCKRMAAAPVGGRHDTLVKLGRLVGGWVGAGHLEAAYAAARLAAAVPGPGNDPAADLATATWAIQSGAASPLDPSDPGPGRGPGGGGGAKRLPTETTVLGSSPTPPAGIEAARRELGAELSRVGAGLLTAATVGVGKTTHLLPTLLTGELDGGGSTVVSTPTKDLVDQATAALREKGIDAFPHFGRHSALIDLRLEGSCAAQNIVSRAEEDTEEEDPDPDFPAREYSQALREYAQRRVITIHEASVKRHPIYETACQSCVMGRKTTLAHSRKLNSPEKGRVRLEKIGGLRDDLDKLGIDFSEVPICEYIVQRLKEDGNYLDENGNTPPAPKVIVAAHPAVSPDLLRAPEGRGKVRLFIADETWPLTEQVVVGPDDVARWQAVLAVRRVQAEQDLLGLLTSAGSSGGDEQQGASERAIAHRRATIDRLRAVGDALGEFGRALAEPPEEFDDDRVLGAWREVAVAASAIVPTGRPAATTAPWEEISWLRNLEGELERTIPLRAIADSLEFALPRESVGAISVVPPSTMGAAQLRFLAAAPATHVLLGDWGKAYRWAIFDATPPWAVRKLAEARAAQDQGVRVVDRPVLVGKVQVHAGRTFGRGRYRGLDCGDSRREARAAQARRRDVAFVTEKLHTFLAERPGRDVAILSHKPLIEQLEKKLKEDKEVAQLLEAGRIRLGWFGRDDRGSNRFAGCDLLVFGVPVPPPYVLRGQWDEARALLHGVCDLPEWDDERVRAVRRLADGTEVPMGVLAPKTPEIQEWWDYELSAAVAQIAGRARPADNPESEIHMWTGFLPDLGRFGFEVEVAAGEPSAVEDVNTLRHLRSMERVAVAAAALARDGEDVTVRGVQEWCRKHGLEAPRNRNVMAWLNYLRANNLAPDDPAALGDLVADLEEVAERVGVDATPAEVAAALADAVEVAVHRGRGLSVLRALGALAGHAYSVSLGLAEWGEDEAGEVARAGP